MAAFTGFSGVEAQIETNEGAEDHQRHRVRRAALRCDDKRKVDATSDCLSRYSVAEGVGFEPTVGLLLRLISSQVHSTTLPPFQLRRKTATEPIAEHLHHISKLS